MGLLVAAASPAFGQLTQTRVAEGALMGKSSGAIAAYLGVPYAAPPTGNNRWKPPGPAAPWTGVRAANKHAASCEQAVTPNGFGPWTKEYVVNGAVSEDCLYINVWTPASNAGERLPVLFWIHGGGFSSGSGSVPIYDGAALAAQGIVVVNINYRVGVYGFLAHPQLTTESSSHSSGNYGLMDQLAALQWVRANIAAFGGDARRITIAGQSAGAASVHFLISSPLAKGLFTQAIAESGSGMGLPVPERAVAEASGRNLGSGGGETLTIKQLRGLNAFELDARVAKMSGGAPPAFRFGPCIDGFFLPDAATLEKNTNDTPILTGITANEAAGINPNFGTATAIAFNGQLQQAYGSFAPKVAALYPATTDRQAAAQFEAHARDRGLAAMYLWAKDRFSQTRHPIYAYLWTHIEPGADSHRYKAFHSSEIPYVFDTLEASQRPYTDTDRAIAKRMSSYWVNFITTGDPNGKGLPTWPVLMSTDKRIMELGDRAQQRAVLSPTRLSAFDEYVKSGGQLGIF